ncbi:hypothetical protein SO802_015200 [Lithocarpus litseifolius]|uniref:Uncharacterized protein n=1 Tax=Lithocarpus litseifolius TaxID=425828 RepID=A0AAW2CVF5_9ROSI
MLSYKSKLVGDIPGAYAQVFKFQADEEEEPLSDEEVDDPSKGTVTIKLSKRTKMNIRAKWAHSFIVKVFGRFVGLGHQKNNCLYTVQERATEMENADASEMGRRDDEVVKSTNPKVIEVGDGKDDYGPWMLVGQKQQASKSRVTHTQSLKSNPE